MTDNIMAPAALAIIKALIVLILVYFFAPFYLILPLMVASVIAADSFAGEKERKTLEALLYTPTTDGELFLAKMLSAWTPAVAVAWGQGPEALAHARAMIDPLQQRLPDPLEAALEAAIQAGEDDGAKAAAQHLERAIQVAKETGYL